MGLRGGRTRGDSRVRPSYVPDVSGEGGFSASGIAPCGRRFSLKVNLPLCFGVLSRYPRWKPGGRYSAHTCTDRRAFSHRKQVPRRASLNAPRRKNYDEIYCHEYDI